MPHTNITTVRRVFMGATTGLGLLTLVIVSYGLSTAAGGADVVIGRLIPQQLREPVWETITAEELRAGDTLQPSTHTIIHIPEEIDRITRKTLFGRSGENIRYWGYCFPQTQEEAEALRRRGYPGTIFLSEKEREIRREKLIAARTKNRIRTLEDLTEENLNPPDTRNYGAIRHQQEIFTGGMACYVMTAEPLPVGMDEDGDNANIRVESDAGSDPKVYDTDGDGLNDGLEIFYSGTDPTQRDTDGDGLIDGIEDANRNGRVDAGESNPTEWDTDRDGLCDGICKIRNGQEIRGEDKNLNGVLDEGETSPVLWDTDGDGINDEQEYFNCLLGGGDDC